MGSSFSCPALAQAAVLHALSSLTRTNVGDLLVTYMRQIGFNTQRLDQKQFMRLFAGALGTSKHELGNAAAVEKLYHLLLKGSGYGMTPSNGIPAMQLIAVLYFLSAPEASTPDEKFDAVVALCQMHPLPPSDTSHMFNHNPPAHLCSAAELNLALEITVLGLARLCCDNVPRDFTGITLASMVDEIFPMAEAGKQNDQNWHFVRSQIMEHKHVCTFLHPFGIDIILIRSISKDVLRNLRSMSNKFLQVSQRIATAQMKRSTMRWGKLKKEVVVKESFANSISKLVNDAQLDAASAALAPRKCLEIILDCSRIAAPHAANMPTLPFLDHEADELERILIASTRDGTVDFRFFKAVSLALLTYKAIDETSLQTRPQGVCENCICYLQRLFNACAPEVGYTDYPAHVIQSVHLARRSILGSVGAAAVAAGAVARSKSYATASIQAGRDQMNTQEDEDEEDDYGLHDLLQKVHTHGMPNVMILTRIQWVYFQCRSYNRHKKDENFKQSVVKFFQKYENTSGDGYIKDTNVIYQFVRDSMCEISHRLFFQINIAALKQEQRTDPLAEIDPKMAKLMTTETTSDTILREHIHFLVAQIKDLCTNPDMPDRGLSIKLIKRNSVSIKEDVTTFTNYFMEAHR
jgi:hypothetical protein